MIATRLRELGIDLPATVAPAYEYVAVAVHGDTAYVSGQLPRLDAQRLITGKLGGNLSVERGQEAARLCILHALAQLQTALGDLDRIQRIVKLTGFVASSPGFNQQPAVIDGASRLLTEIFGERGRHARSAIGVAELPRDAAVEIEMVVAVRPR